MDPSHDYSPSNGAPCDGIWGTVVAVQANYYWVRLEVAHHRPIISSATISSVTTSNATAEHSAHIVRETDLATRLAQECPQRLLCTRRSRLKKIGQKVMVGDRVRVEEPDWADGRGAISEVWPRHTVLDRPPVANATQILLMFSLANPPMEAQQLSRFLVKAESTGLQVQLCFNKQDLVADAARQIWQQRLQRWGYEAITISVAEKEGVEALTGRLQDQITVISGPSGVGKSSLINQLIPDADLKTSAVSGKLGRGRHTTRHVELFELPGGGFLADTPGFNQPDISIPPEALGDCFPEVRQRLGNMACQFNDCLHRDEPGCAVGADWERHALYLAMLDEAGAIQELERERQDTESHLKVKVGGLGQIQHEPKLQAKKYRRVSRRSQNQALDELRYDMPDSLEDLEDWDELGLDT
jgi:ribosome biogenesis GTPase